ncbi:TPA: hypothetical protein J1270_004591 [Escherichia coli]|nr:hypothetical protein [Escherichia coli]
MQRIAIVVLPHMAVLMTQRLHSFNKRVNWEVFGIEGDFIYYPAAAVSSNKAPVTEITHCIFAVLESNQTIREFAVKKALITGCSEPPRLNSLRKR